MSTLVHFGRPLTKRYPPTSSCTALTRDGAVAPILYRAIRQYISPQGNMRGGDYMTERRTRVGYDILRFIQSTLLVGDEHRQFCCRARSLRLVNGKHGSGMNAIYRFRGGSGQEFPGGGCML